jgi:glycosyltransferase involved in cell wall biosynthesis
MSPANKTYLLKHYPWIDSGKVEVSPNSIEPRYMHATAAQKLQFRLERNIPKDAVIFTYGGNLGKPQGIDFLIKVLESNAGRKDCFFIIIGSGTEKKKIQDWFKKNKPGNALFYDLMLKEEFDSLLCVSDVGLIFLDQRFTIPNYPSRLLSYLECRLPVVIASDKHTDLGKTASGNNYGLWSESGDIQTFNSNINQLVANKETISKMGENAYAYLCENFHASVAAENILKHFNPSSAHDKKRN